MPIPDSPSSDCEGLNKNYGLFGSCKGVSIEMRENCKRPVSTPLSLDRAGTMKLGWRSYRLSGLDRSDHSAPGCSQERFFAASWASRCSRRSGGGVVGGTMGRSFGSAAKAAVCAGSGAAVSPTIAGMAIRGDKREGLLLFEGNLTGGKIESRSPWLQVSFHKSRRKKFAHLLQLGPGAT